MPTSDKRKSSFVLYHDIREPLELLTDDQRGQLFFAILDYSQFGTIPKFEGALQMAFAFIKMALDRDAEAWESKREKRREAGSLGGRQKVANQANATFAKQKVANQAVPVPVPVPDLVPVPVKNNNADKPPRASRFTPPSLEEVTAYCRERGNGVDAQAFIDHYTVSGWMRGKTKIRDWRACVRTWEKNNEKGSRDVRDPARYTYKEGVDSL